MYLGVFGAVSGPSVRIQYGDGIDKPPAGVTAEKGVFRGCGMKAYPRPHNHEKDHYQAAQRRIIKDLPNPGEYNGHRQNNIRIHGPAWPAGANLSCLIIRSFLFGFCAQLNVFLQLNPYRLQCNGP